MRRWFKRSAGKDPQKTDQPPRVQRGKTRFVYIAGLFLALSALFMPFSATFCDLAIVTVICLAIVLPLFAMIAKDPADISSFPMIITAVSLGRLFSNILVAKGIMTNEQPGIVIMTAGTAYQGIYTFWALEGISLLVCVLAWRSGISISKKSVHFIVEVLPWRRQILESDLNLAKITPAEHQKSSRILQLQHRFYFGMATMARFVVCDCVLALSVLVITGLGSAVLGASSEQGVHGYLQATVGMGLTGFAPILMCSVLTMGIAVRRFYKFQLPSSPDENSTERLKISNRVLPVPGKSEESAAETELQVEQAARPKTFETEFLSGDETLIPDEESRSAEEPELSELQIAADDHSAAVSDELEEKYAAIAQLASSSSKCKLLLAGTGSDVLGVNYAVNVGIQLASICKTIIIDTDESRSAIAATFELPAESIAGKAVGTCIENLWVTSIRAHAGLGLAKVAKNAAKIFDYVVIYSPSAANDPALQCVADCTVVFAAEAEQARGFANQFKTLDGQVYSSDELLSIRTGNAA